MGRGPTLQGSLVEVTENAAIAAAQTMGFSDHQRSDRVAAEAMRRALDHIDIVGRIVIGERQREGASAIVNGEVVGGGTDSDDASIVDLAVLPLEGTHQCATGAPGAVTLMAAAERGGLLEVPDVYMEKIIVGPTARGVIHLDAPVPENLRNIARAFHREVSDLTVVVLDRPRHRQMIHDIRAAGARIRLISDGDLAASISAAVRGTGVHAVMGIGGAPEGVLTAAAMRCLGGEIQARLVVRQEDCEKRLAEAGFHNLRRIYTSTDLAPGDSLFLCTTGVTDTELLRGVRFFGGGCRTSSLLMSLTDGMVRFVDSVRRDDTGQPVQFY